MPEYSFDTHEIKKSNCEDTVCHAIRNMENMSDVTFGLKKNHVFDLTRNTLIRTEFKHVSNI